jgi:hypothetical protein
MSTEPIPRRDGTNSDACESRGCFRDVIAVFRLLRLWRILHGFNLRSTLQKKGNASNVQFDVQRDGEKRNVVSSSVSSKKTYVMGAVRKTA